MASSYNYGKDNFPKTGYTIIYAQLDDDSYDAVKARVMNHNEDQYELIFKDFTVASEPVISEDRLQSKSITKGTSSDRHWHHMKNKIETHLKNIHRTEEPNEQLKMKYFAALWSKAGCAQQIDHTDFSPQDIPLYSGILSFDASTKLTIFVKNGDTKDVFIPPGFFILFSANCKHAGSHYPEENKRLFFKVMPSNHKLPKMEAQSVNKKAFQCPHCKLGGGDTEEGLKYHIEMQCSNSSSVVSSHYREAKTAKRREYNRVAYLKRKQARVEEENRHINV